MYSTRRNTPNEYIMNSLQLMKIVSLDVFVFNGYFPFIEVTSATNHQKGDFLKNS